MALRGNMRKPLPILSTAYPTRSISALTYKKKKGKAFSFPPDLRQYHMQVLGTPGGGKTKFLEACIRDDIKKQNGLLLFDPAGNLYSDVVKWCVQHRYLERRPIVLLNPNDPVSTFAFNPLEIDEVAGESVRQRQIRIEHVVDATMLAIGAIQGGEDPEALPEYNRIMRLILRTLTASRLTLCDAQIFTDHANKSQREPLCAALALRADRQTWLEMEAMGEKRRQAYDDLMRAPRNRFARFHSASLSCVVGQQKSSFNFREAMDQGAVVLVNLGSSGLGFTRTESTILGRLLFNNLVLKSEQRYRINGRAPRPFYCYIDECDRYLNNDVANAIDKLRQFGLRMILSHQNIGQLDDAGIKVRGAVLGSTAVKVYFSLTTEDASLVAKAVYGVRIQLDKEIRKYNKPVVVDHNREHMHSLSEGETVGQGRAVARGEGTMNSVTSGLALRGDSAFFGLGEVEISHSEGKGSGSSYLTSVAESNFYSKSVSNSVSEALVPELAWLPSQRYSLEEQLMKQEHKLTHFGQGECVVTLPHAVSFDARVNWITDSVVTDDRLQGAHDRYHHAHPEMFAQKDDVFRAINIEASYIDDSSDETEADDNDFFAPSSRMP